MKKLLIFLILFLLLTLPCHAGMLVQKVVSSSCTTATDSELITQNTADTLWQVTEAKQVAQQFTVSGSTTVTGIMLSLEQDYGSSSSFTVEIFTDDNTDDKPDTLVTGASKSIAYASIPVEGSVGEVFFEFSSPIVLSADDYHIVLSATSGGAYNVRRNSTSVVSYIYNYSSDTGSTWTAYDRELWFEVWGCN